MLDAGRRCCSRQKLFSRHLQSRNTEVKRISSGGNSTWTGVCFFANVGKVNGRTVLNKYEFWGVNYFKGDTTLTSE